MKLLSRATVLMFSLWLIGSAGLSQAAPTQTSSQSSGQPDVLVLVFSVPGGPDQVGLTYPGVVPHSQALRDVRLIQAATGWNVSGVRITDQSAPIQKATGKMTGVDFVVPGAVTLQSHMLLVEPFVNSLRSYHHVTLTYLVGKDFTFQGLRDYTDPGNHIQIALDQRGSTYTYQIYYRNGHFGHISLPRYQLPTTEGRSVQTPARRAVTPWLMALAALAAVGAGGVVYAILARNA